MSYDVFDIVVVPFPFADRDVVRKRPALILTPYAGFGEATGVCVIAMITAARNSEWPNDVSIDDLSAAGLAHACFVRMKLATLTYDRIERRQGALAANDRAMVSEALIALLPTGRGSAALSPT